MNNEPVALTQGDILSILQDANSVLLGQAIWNSTEEYNKLKAIIESAIRYTHPVKEQNGCGNCHACLVGVTEHGLPATFQRMILCPDCGNKRCPKASNHRHQCTESNEPNQRGSIYTHPVKEHFEDEPQAEELHEILQSNSHPVKEQLTDDELIEGAILPLSLVLKNPNATGGDLREAFLKSARQILWLANRKAQE